MFRRFVALGLVLGLQSFAWAGSGVHAHLDTHGTDHHDGRVVHAHAASHAAPTAAGDDHAVDIDLHAPDDGAVLALDPFVAVEGASLEHVALAAVAFAALAPDQLVAKGRLDADGGHDPPFLSSRSTRAPPHR